MHARCLNKLNFKVITFKYIYLEQKCIEKSIINDINYKYINLI